ncbi:hypothetical protein NGB36_29135 [Streptomyces sp. RB6PN25]|uniref:Uncharacterized protein n=1 Tax=Streptomyces humicola TaxID=2953240 RepID=A0ABT1Q3N8_9ACTN|nr:hypothetical protein [Streptomyces humicola]MCQ4084529.1 hypothetical protein [Streptomyces humicola]
MFRRGESVPFAFVAEADRFRSNVTPPPRERPGKAQVAARVLAVLTVVAGLVGAVVLGTPALEQRPADVPHQQAESAQHG